MEIFEIDGTSERLAITALCMDTQVLEALSPGWQDDCLPSRWSNVVARWAVSYFRTHKQAPGVQGVTALFTDWAPTADKDTVELVSRWLTGLEPETGIASGYAIEKVRKLITKTSAKRLADKITGALANGKIEEAAQVIEAWSRPKATENLDYLSLFDSPEQVSSILASVNTESVVQYKGRLGEFINPLLIRDAFVAFLAPAKRGKSTLLMDIAWKGALQSRKVALFSTGDMSQGQILDRLLVKAARTPKHAGRFYIPKEFSYKDKELVIARDEHIAMADLNRETAATMFGKYAGDDRFRIVSKSAGTVTAADIADTLHRWADEGWVADVVVIDYADILRGLGNSKESRDLINENWIRMRALSTELRCLLVTATQADTEGMEAWMLSARMFSDCRKKWDHATAILGINSTPYEKRNGVFRVNHILLREGEFAQDLPPMVAVAGCPKVGCPVILSDWV